MYDKLVLWLSFIHYLPVAATDLVTIKGRFGPYTRARLGNLVLILNEDGLTIIGSLHKFHTGGHNVSPFSFVDALEAFKKLQELLGFDLDQAAVLSLEFGATFVVSRSAIWYTSVMGTVSRFRRDTYGNQQSLILLNSRRSYKLYDKAAEAKAHRLPVPVEYQGKHLLRLELRFIRKLSKTFGRKLTVADLKAPATFLELLQAWRDFYFSIPKERKAFVKPPKTKRELINNLAAVGLVALGTSSTLVQDLDRRTDVSAPTRSKLKAVVRSISQDPQFTLTDDLIEELDALVEATVARGV